MSYGQCNGYAPTAIYRLDTSGDTYINNFHATAQSGVSYSEEWGKFGKGAGFGLQAGGIDITGITRNTSISLPNLGASARAAHTVVFWVFIKYGIDSKINALQTPFGYGAGTSRSSDLNHYYSDGTGITWYWSSTGDDYAFPSTTCIMRPEQRQSGQWHMLMKAYDLNGITTDQEPPGCRFYFDGGLVSQYHVPTGTYQILASNQKYGLGWDWPYNTRWFKGGVDDLIFSLTSWTDSQCRRYGAYQRGRCAFNMI